MTKGGVRRARAEGAKTRRLPLGASSVAEGN